MTDKVSESSYAKEPPVVSEAYKSKIREDMRMLDREIGDWREHVPFEVALDYYSDPSLMRTHSAHVDNCSYCQDLLENLHPPERLVEEFEVAVALATDSGQTAPGRSSSGFLGKLLGLA